MKKCDFCKKSNSNGECRTSGMSRDFYCEQALERIEELFKNPAEKERYIKEIIKD